VIEAQMNYIMKSLDAMKQRGKSSVDIKPQAEADYTEMVHSEMKKTVWKTGGCNSWYQSKSGHVIAMFPGFSFTYRQMANNFKADHHVFN
jgi:hypothetical protein